MRANLIVSLAIVLAAPAWAAKPQVASDAPLLAQAGGTTKPSGGSSDDEEDEAPVTPTGKPPPTGTTPPPAGTTPPPAGTANTPPPAGATTPSGAAAAKAAHEQDLVSGAPLYNPNVAVHIVEQKAFSDSRKREVILFPAIAHINGKFTQDFGTAIGFVWHLHENFGIQLMGQYNWINEESGLQRELINKVRAEAQAATSLLLFWGAIGGVEVTPLYGKFHLLREHAGPLFPRAQRRRRPRRHPPPAQASQRPGAAERVARWTRRPARRPTATPAPASWESSAAASACRSATASPCASRCATSSTPRASTR